MSDKEPQPDILRYCRYHDLAYCHKHSATPCFSRDCKLEDEPRAKFCAICTGLVAAVPKEESKNE
jgi:hypothetical protein